MDPDVYKRLLDSSTSCGAAAVLYCIASLSGTLLHLKWSELPRIA